MYPILRPVQSESFENSFHLNVCSRDNGPPELAQLCAAFSAIRQCRVWKVLTLLSAIDQKYMYRIARKFCGVEFSRKLIQLSFRDFIFTGSDPIAIINDKYSFAD